ncbi:MAG: BatD family protein [Candidatus Omnitrophica bacterium]|nr:BatD family protein [Candidatus Omnitrophota bacterium]
MKILAGIVSGVIILFASAALAADVPVELTLDRNTAEIGDMVQLSLVFNNTRGVPAPRLPDTPGFRSQYLGPSTVMSIVNGVTSASITHRYRLVALQKGTFKLGPYSFNLKGVAYTTSVQEITVVDRGQAPQASAAPASSPESDFNGRIFLVLAAEKNKGYRNERIPVTVKLYINQLGVRDIQYPVLEGQGYVSEGFGRARQYRETLGGAGYDVVEFRTAVSSTKEGQVTLGPASLKCNIIAKKEPRRAGSGMNDFFDDSFFNDFLGRVQLYSKEVRSPELALTILPFPEPDRPREFNGAVGQFQMEASGSPTEVKAGDPITLIMKISGSGNFDSVQSPQLISAEGFKVYNAEARTTDNGKTFEQVIIPLSEKITETPAVRFAYFDPATEQYGVCEQKPTAIQVSPSTEKNAQIVDATRSPSASAAATRVLGKDIVYIKDDIGEVRAKGVFRHQNRWLPALLLAPFFLVAGVYVFQRRQDRLSSDVRYARKLRAPKIARDKLKTARAYLQQNKTALFYDQIFKTLQEYLGHRFNIPSGGITADGADELLSREGAAEDIRAKLKACFGDCDSARYAVAAFDQASMKQTLSAVEEMIDYLERKKR